ATGKGPAVACPRCAAIAPCGRGRAALDPTAQSNLSHSRDALIVPRPHQTSRAPSGHTAAAVLDSDAQGRRLWAGWVLEPVKLAVPAGIWDHCRMVRWRGGQAGDR